MLEFSNRKYLFSRDSRTCKIYALSWDFCFFFISAYGKCLWATMSKSNLIGYDTLFEIWNKFAQVRKEPRFKNNMALFLVVDTYEREPCWWCWIERVFWIVCDYESKISQHALYSSWLISAPFIWLDTLRVIWSMQKKIKLSELSIIWWLFWRIA